MEFSPYHYSLDNPIRFSDPDGRIPGPGSPIQGNPKIYILEGFRQYIQAAGAFVDRFFVSLSTEGDKETSNAQVNTRDGSLNVTTSGNAVNTTTIGTNFKSFLSMNSQNSPQGPLTKETNTTVASQQTTIEASGTIRGVDVKVTNTTNVSSSKVSNTTEISAGKTLPLPQGANVTAAAYVSKEKTSSSSGNSSQTDVGIKAGVSYKPTPSSTVTQTVRVGFTLQND